MRWLPLLVGLVLVLACQPPRESGAEVAVAFQVLSKGEVVDLEPHLHSGKVTVFDVYADWCPPCKDLDRSLVSLKKTYPQRLEVYKLDLVDWNSALAQHHGIRDLPYLMVYDEEKNLMGNGPSNKVLPELIAHLNR